MEERRIATRRRGHTSATAGLNADQIAAAALKALGVDAARGAVRA